MDSILTHLTVGRNGEAMKIVSLAVLCGVLMLSSCRHHAPVARHFLRMPAEYAGGLSSIQRAKWLKENRRRLPDRKTLTATNHLILPGISTLRGTVLRGMEVLHVAESSCNGGLAVVTTPGDNLDVAPHLALLTYDHAVYANAARKIEVSGAPAAWRIDSSNRAITGFSRSGSPVAEVWWSGHGWRTRRLP